MFMECGMLSSSGGDPSAPAKITLVRGLKSATASVEVYYLKSTQVITTTAGSFKPNNLGVSIFLKFFKFIKILRYMRMIGYIKKKDTTA